METRRFIAEQLSFTFAIPCLLKGRCHLDVKVFGEVLQTISSSINYFSLCKVGYRTKNKKTLCISLRVRQNNWKNVSLTFFKG